jgi:hypothetical protein
LISIQITFSPPILLLSATHHRQAATIVSSLSAKKPKKVSTTIDNKLEILRHVEEMQTHGCSLRGAAKEFNARSDDSSVEEEERQVDSPTSFLDDNMQSLPQTIELLRNLHATAANNRCEEDDDGRSTASNSDNSSNTVNKNSEPLLP